VGVIELLVGGPLAYFGWRYLPELFRNPSPSTHLDDYLGFAALAVTCLVTVVAAVVTLLQSRLSYGLIRGARIGPVFSDVWMLLTGVGMSVIARRRGGDWAGFSPAFSLLPLGQSF